LVGIGNNIIKGLAFKDDGLFAYSTMTYSPTLEEKYGDDGISIVKISHPEGVFAEGASI
jgi:hypothetical protein